MSLIITTLFITLVASMTDAQPDSIRLCQPHAIWSNCASLCPRTCENPKPVPCPLICVRRCVCLPGFIQVSRTNTTCIANCDCPNLKFE
ncbi:chymotrypsin-elastase inhibitor ixodidin-like [Leptopilina boulardi]|uniref:chymotrypsin-elastase inhibitor ixodidin-like n=1 Tax=Leptopilina boulardi TaxID=63433 RepID=UPI0021F63052|nr:chymotrypsin-elastase inhibitor ixodidin-like [Leptopilina boulardi]